MATPRSFREIIELWASNADMAEEIRGDDELSAFAVEKWRQRDSIPAVWWSAILARPRVKKAGVTATLMASFAGRSRLASDARRVAR